MPDTTLKGKIHSQAIGAAGELIAQARLLIRGWLVGNINQGGLMNAPAIDLIAAKGSKTVRFAVKTTGHNNSNVQWSAEYGWTTLFKGAVVPDFVIFVWFNSPSDRDSCRVFVVPARKVDRDVRKAHEHWHSNKKRDGSDRKKSNHVGISWLGAPTEGNIARGFAEKWKSYEENWSQLDD